jgi:glutamyl-tRNA reductase
MWIAVVGIDHTSAPIDLREQLACSPAQALEVMSAARPTGLECVLLSTCNRVELYATGSGRFDQTTETRLLHMLCEFGEARRVDFTDVQAHSYCYTGKATVSHLFEVACGLRSLILGEPQIQGQVVEALEEARVAGSSGPVVSALFRTAIVAGKRARSETGISRSAVSVSHVAVQLARQLFPQLSEATVLLIGSGQMSELAARNLRDNGAGRLIIINRTLDRAIEFASRNGAAYHPIEELPAALVDADVIISSTHAPHALITVDMMREALRQKWERENSYQGDREGAPLPYTNDAEANNACRVGAHPRGRPGSAQQLLIDIAMPRDIEPAVAALPGVYLYNLDDLQAGVSQGMEQRAREIAHVRAIIAEEVGEFELWLRTRAAVGAISELRQHAEELRQKELERTLRQLSPTLSEREINAIQALSKSLVNKLLHTPTVRLKEAASEGESRAYAEAFHYIFDLEVQHEEEYYDWDAGEQAGDDSDALGHRTSATVMVRAGGED